MMIILLSLSLVSFTVAIKKQPSTVQKILQPELKLIPTLNANDDITFTTGVSMHGWC